MGALAHYRLETTMPTDTRLVICDADRTLANNQRMLSERTKRMIAQLAQQGVLFGIASGRPVADSLHMCRKWGLTEEPDVMIGNNGSELWIRETNESFHYHLLSTDILKDVVEQMNELFPFANPQMYVPETLLVGFADDKYLGSAERAGRDGHRSYAVLLYNSNDQAKLQRRIADEFPEKDFIRRVYDDLAYFYQVGVGSGYNAVFELPIEKFCRTYKLFPTQVIPALKILTRAGYIEYKEEDESQARVMFILERDDLYKLQGNSPTEETIIVMLLRKYSGLFNGYTYIDEAYLAQQTGLSMPEVYLTLKSLSQKRIISFIPQKKTPYVRYTQRREDSVHLQFPPAVYDDLKQRFAERIEKMIDYASTTNQCRSRMLLRYFGEDNPNDCGYCDVCTDRKRELEKKEKVTEAQSLVMELLADGEPHHISQLHALPLPFETIELAVNTLIQSSAVCDDNGILKIND